MSTVELKCHIVGAQPALDKFFKDIGYTVVSNLEESDFVVFGGGPDVSPRLYYQNKLSFTNSSDSRDQDEILAYFQAKLHRKVCVGICRGAQFLWVMNNGELYQDVDNHKTPHKAVVVEDGKETDKSFWVSSTHHQMISSSHTKIDAKFLVVSDETTYRKSGASNLNTVNPSSFTTIKRSPGQSYSPNRKDVEAYYIPRTECFGVQFHPEYQKKEDESLEWFKDTLENILWTGEVK